VRCRNIKKKKYRRKKEKKGISFCPKLLHSNRNRERENVCGDLRLHRRSNLAIPSEHPRDHQRIGRVYSDHCIYPETEYFPVYAVIWNQGVPHKPSRALKPPQHRRISIDRLSDYRSWGSLLWHQPWTGKLVAQILESYIDVFEDLSHLH
jgi:hypothetical protein